MFKNNSQQTSDDCENSSEHIESNSNETEQDNLNITKEIENSDQIIENLELKLEQAESAKMRALADLENYRRRSTEEKQSWTNFAVSNFLRQFLPKFGELQLGSEHTTDQDIKKVINDFFLNLKKMKIEQIETKPGEEIDTEKHEVLMNEKGDPGKVVRILESGWQYQDKIITPVKVSGASIL